MQKIYITIEYRSRKFYNKLRLFGVSNKNDMSFFLLLFHSSSFHEWRSFTNHFFFFLFWHDPNSKWNRNVVFHLKMMDEKRIWNGPNRNYSGRYIIVYTSRRHRNTTTFHFFFFSFRKMKNLNMYREKVPEAVTNFLSST